MSMPNTNLAKRLTFTAATAALLAISVISGVQTHATIRPPDQTSRPTMQTFAFLFRPTQTVTPDVLSRRNAAAREWALARQQDGTLQFPSPLEEEGVLVRRDGTIHVTDPRAVAAVLVIRASHLDAAVTLAKTHPGLAFGTEIEVRRVKTTATTR